MVPMGLYYIELLEYLKSYSVFQIQDSISQSLNREEYCISLFPKFSLHIYKYRYVYIFIV